MRRGLPPTWRTAASFLAICAGAFALRVLFIRSNADAAWPYSIFYYGDAQHFHAYASSLLRGVPYDNDLPFHPPGFAWLLAGLYQVLGASGGSRLSLKLVLAGLNAVTVGVAWLWWRRLLGGPWAVLAAVLLATHFGWLVFSATLNNEVLYALWLTLTAALTWHWRERLPWPGALAIGFVMAAGSLTRAEHLALWPFLLLFVLRERTRALPLRAHALRWGGAALLSVALLLPWAVRNAAAIGRYNERTASLEPMSRAVLVSSYGPVNFAIANGAHADGGFRPDGLERLAGTAKLELADARVRELFIHGYAVGLRWLWENPGAAVSLLWRKLERWLDGFRLGWGVSNLPGGLRGNRAPVDLFVPEGEWLRWPLAVLLAVGVAFSLRSAHRAFLLCSLVVAHRLVVTLLFFGYARGLVVMLPVIVPLLLLPWTRLAAGPDRRWVPLGLAGAIVLGVGVEAAVVASRAPRSYMADGYIDGTTRKIIQDDWVRLWPSASDP